MKIFVSKQVKRPFKYKSGDEMGKSQGTGEQERYGKTGEESRDW